MSDGLVGIDIGTSSVKVLLTRTDGAVVAQASRSYETYSPKAGWAEQNPVEWYCCAQEAASEVLLKAVELDRGLQIRSVGFTGQMHSFVLLDEQGDVIRPAITWMDSRARDLISETTGALEELGLLTRLQNMPAPGLTLLPLLWLARHEPEVLERTHTLLLAKDYLRYRMTGDLATDTTDASGTLLMDMSGRTWMQELSEVFSLNMGILPEIREPWAHSGTTKGIPKSLKRMEGVPAAIGCADQQAAALANGVLTPGVVQIMLGTGGQIATPVPECPRAVNRSLNVFCHHSGWLLQGSIQNAGSALNWIRRMLDSEWHDFDDAIASSKRAPSPFFPFFLPYLTGERTPIMSASATGAWLDIRQSHERKDLLYAGIEGVVFGIADALEAVLTAVGTAVSEIRIGGGGTRSTGYLSLLSDTTDQTVHVLSESNTTALGAAILGGVAAGIFPDLKAAVESMAIEADRIIEPDSHRHTDLMERRNRWKDLSHHLT